MSISYTNIVRDYIDVISQQNETLSKLMDFLRETTAARTGNSIPFRQSSRNRTFSRNLNRVSGLGTTTHIPSSRVTPSRVTPLREPPIENRNRTTNENVTPLSGNPNLFTGLNNANILPLNIQRTNDASVGTFIDQALSSLLTPENNLLNNNTLGQLLFHTTIPFGTDLESVPIQASQERINEVMEDISLADIPVIDGHSPTCPIDLQQLTQQDNIVKLRSCGHIFKKDNIRQWFTNSPYCPVCRRDIREPFNNNNNTNNNNNSTTTTLDENELLNSAIDEVINSEQKDDDSQSHSQSQPRLENDVNYIV